MACRRSKASRLWNKSPRASCARGSPSGFWCRRGGWERLKQICCGPIRRSVPRISWKPGHTGTPTRPKSNGRSKPTKRPEGGGVAASLETNENFPLPAAEELRRLGHDVLTVQESGLGGQATTDDEVLRFATRHQRVLVTLNRAHFVRLHAADSGHAGIIVCTADGNFLALAARIDGMIRDQGPLEGRLARVHRPS